MVDELTVSNPVLMVDVGDPDDPALDQLICRYSVKGREDSVTEQVIELSVEASGVFRPETYGAVRDGVQDDGPAIQLALDAAKANGGGTVLLSPGTYGTSQNLGLTSATGVTVRGAGMGASTIKDLRADDATGAPTGTYYGLFSAVSCSDVNLRDLSLIGRVAVVDLGTGGTSSLGAKATYFHGSTKCSVVGVHATLFRDEAIFADGDCAGWFVARCRVHQSNSNAINLNSSAVQSAGSIIALNRCTDNEGSAIIYGGNGVLCVGNYCSAGTPRYDSDLCVVDSSAVSIFADNVLCDSTYTTGVSAIHVFGSAATAANVKISNNLIDGITASWRLTGGAAIRVSSVASDPSGHVSITGNTIRNCTGLVDDVHRAILIENCAATFTAYIDGNDLGGDTSAYMRTAILVRNMAAGANVVIGANSLVGWLTDYDVDTSATFSGSTFTSARSIDHTATPYAALVSDSLVLCDTTTAVLTYTLPAVASSAGRHIQVADWGQNASGNAITVAAQGAETINGVASITITTDGASAYCYCDGSAWKTLAPVV